jgi:cytochrome c oxidase subunit 3
LALYQHGLNISSSLFGTTFYSLVGLHAFHVIVGATGLTIILIFSLFGKVKQEHSARVSVFAMYWHFVDAIWVVVLSVVYFIAR